MSNFYSQSNTKTGDKVHPAGVDLTGKQGLLAVLLNNAGVPKVQLPGALTDIPLYVIGDVQNGGIGKHVTLLPLDTNEERRVFLKGTCNPGDKLVLADPTASAGADAGKVRALPATPGIYVQVGESEEIGVDGQLILLRPHVRLVTVVQPFSGLIPAATASALTSYGYTQAQADALIATVRDMRAALIALGFMS